MTSTMTVVLKLTLALALPPKPACKRTLGAKMIVMQKRDGRRFCLYSGNC